MVNIEQWSVELYNVDGGQSLGVVDDKFGVVVSNGPLNLSLLINLAL